MSSQREMFQFTAALAEQPDEQSLHKDEALQKHLHKRSDLPSAPTHMNFKWNKPPAGDGSDHRRGFIPVIGGGGQSNEYLGVNGSKHSWRTLGKAILDNKSTLNHKVYAPAMMQQQQQQQHHQNNKDDDSDDTDNTNNSSRAPSSKYKRSPHSDSMHSKISSHSFNEIMNDAMPSYYNLQQNKSSNVMDGDAIHDHNSHNLNDSYKSLPNTGDWPNSGKMNFIMLLGLLVGLVISKTLQYLQLYFGWFQSQVLQLRIALLGSISIFDFFNFDDNSRFGVRTKLLLLPVVATFSLLYGTIVFLHHVIRFLLTQAPSGLVNFIQKLYIDI